MTDAEFRVFQKRYHRLFKEWTTESGLGWYRVESVFDREGSYFPRGSKQDGDVAMMTTTKWEYRWAQITVNVPICAQFDDEKLESSLLHELMHVFLAPISSEMREHEELVATTLERAFVWVRDAAKKGKL